MVAPLGFNIPSRASVLPKPDADEQRVLEYLYTCFSGEVSLDLDFLDAEHFSVDERHWPELIKGLLDRGYITGVLIERVHGHELICFTPDVIITRKGINYLKGTA